MRKLLLVGLIAAAPMLVAPNSASAWGCGYGYATRAIRLHGSPLLLRVHRAPLLRLQLRRASLALLWCANLRLACRIRRPQMGMGRKTSLVGNACGGQSKR